MAAAAILDFQKFEGFTVEPLYGANMRHRAKFHHNPSKGCRDIVIGTTHYDDFVVSIVVQNLVEIDAVVSII